MMTRHHRFAPLIALALLISIGGVAYVRTSSSGHETSRYSEGIGSPSPSTPPPQAPTATTHQNLTLADAFALAYRAATRSGGAILWNEKVVYLVGGRRAGTVGAAQVADPAAWTRCPADATSYAGRKCPVSLADVISSLAATGTKLVIEPGMPKAVGCDKVSVPRKIVGRPVVTIRPDAAHRDCFSDFAITLFLEESQRVRAVSLVLSSP